ncbi:class I SAM-dependent methyltransferase [Burkholderia gladioli]|uniref:class I SAM-dependent methyltransferase n=1 Tax=Burkholderia gladioli TaxID=28095 RepID=UPI00163F5C64|nr:DNA methyltransferase [Burkholderia gladioli]
MNEQFVDVTDLDQLWDRPLKQAVTSELWGENSTKEARMHRIHTYPAKFPAFLAELGIRYAMESGVRVRTVGDIFCGCGTVAHEARRLGLKFWGCDINPVATLIARAKSADIAPGEFIRQLALVLHEFDRASADVSLAPSARDRLQRWFRPEQFADLARLVNSIRLITADGSAMRDVLLCLFSSILKSCSQWKVRAIKPTFDLNKVPASVIAAFSQQAHFLITAAVEAGDMSGQPQASIHLGSALTIECPPGGLDLLISSPPYVTSYEYADLHQLSSLFLGYADDHRDLREGSIGSTQHDFRLNKGIASLNSTATRVVFSLYDHDKRAAQSIANYFVDMQKVAVRARHLVKPRGVAMFVIGNTQYHGVDVDNAGHLTESLLRAGFRRVRAVKRAISNKSATPYRTSTGRFSRAQTANHIYSHEYVLMAHR